jgi:deoxyribodipyrimidine photo-lyase
LKWISHVIVGLSYDLLIIFNRNRKKRNKNMKKPLIIHWFRQDLRLSDNQALQKASSMGEVLPIYILDDINAGDDKMGEASRVWLHHSLTDLQQSLRGKLKFFIGDAKIIIQQLTEELKPVAISWSRCYEPWRITRDSAIKEWLKSTEVQVISENSALLFEPWKILKDDGTPYRVFSPFFRKGCFNAEPPHKPLGKAEPELSDSSPSNATSLSALELLPKIGWDKALAEHFVISEQGAQTRLSEFFVDGLNGYKINRDFPSKTNVSRLSPYLHFGQISPNQVWYAAKELHESIPEKDLEHFLSELGWREFSYNLLYHNPKLRTQNMQRKFDAFPWGDDETALKAWQNGATGIPIVDAAMRELYQTGYMHNRPRMIVGSFLVKNLLLDWRLGEKWFWNCLFDADMASNAASWQWVAGSGADAAPYFRIFNAITQGEKFDPNGDYIKKYVPELRNLKAPYIFAPRLAPSLILDDAGVRLGKNYPNPIIDLSASRERALSAFALLKVESS